MLPYHEKMLNPEATFASPSSLHIVLIFILLHYSPCSYSQQYSFRNYSIAHGLGSSNVNHIFQDSRGYLWFATQGGGASRFNGREFKNFTRADGLVNNDVTYITEDKKGNLWIATAAGASEFNGSSFRNYRQQEGLSDGVVYAVYSDDKNNIWFATQNDGIKIYDGTEFDSLTTHHGLPSNEVYCITQDLHGIYWFGLSDGIASYKDGKVISYRDSAQIQGKAVFSAHPDDNGEIWFGTIGSGVIILRDNSSFQPLDLPAPFQNDFIGGITRDKRGNFWLATDHGVLKYNGKEFKNFSEHEGLSSNSAQAITCDYEGNIWTGMLGGGADALSSEAFVSYKDESGLMSRNITCIHRDPIEKIYFIGTGDGLYIFSPSSVPSFKKAQGVPEIGQTHITSISVDKAGLLWICTQEEIYTLENIDDNLRLIKKYAEIDGERIVSPIKIIHDSKGNGWIATYGSGIFYIGPNAQKSYSKKNAFYSDKILSIYEDSRSNIWFGTYDAGIIKYDGERFQPVSLTENSFDKSVWAITEDGNGNIYWGTGESGFCRFDGKTITSYGISDGLRSSYIAALAWNQHDNSVWLGSETGLDKIKFSADYKIEKLHAFLDHDGFKPAGINHDAILIDEAGLMWLGTSDGLWRYDRTVDQEGRTPPKIQLTGVRLFYQKADWRKYADSIAGRTELPCNLHLPYNKNHLTFDIQALTTQEVYYTFILEGQDQTWSAPSTNNEITYSNISPGNYTFKANAINQDGISSSEQVSFSFIVSPPWWSTWWFRIAAFLAAAGTLIAFIKARERALREQNLRLETTVKERTSQIAHQKEIVEQTLSEREELLREKEVLLKEIHHRVKNNLQTISSMLMLQSEGLEDEQAKKAIAESQSRVRSIALVHQKLYQTEGLEKVELNAFVKDLTEQVKSLFCQRTKQVSIDRKIPETFILIDAAIPLGLILNELLTNSFKYAFNMTESGWIMIELKNTNAAPDIINGKVKTRSVKLIYRDSGPGLESADVIENATTLGLRLISLLSQQIGASLDYSNANGCEFTFTFDLNV